MLGRLMELLQQRTAETYVIKIKSHVGHEDNDAVDELADKGRKSEEEITYEPKLVNKMYLIGEGKSDKIAWVQMRKEASDIRTRMA